MSLPSPKANATQQASPPKQLEQYQKLASVAKRLVSRDILASSLDNDFLFVIRQRIPKFVESGDITSIQAFKLRGIVWAVLRKREQEAECQQYEARELQFYKKMIKSAQERILKRKLQKQQENSSFLDKFVLKIFNAFKTSTQYKEVSQEEEEEIPSLKEGYKDETLTKHNTMRSLKRQLSKKQNPKQK